MDGRPDQRDRNRTAVQSLNQLGMLTAPPQLTAEDVLDQGEAFSLGVLIQQIEQCRQGQAYRLLGLPVGQRLRRRVHERNGAVHISGNHAIADRLQGDLRALFFQLQGIGKRMALCQKLMGAPQRQDNQPKRRRQVSEQQEPQDHSRPLAQCIAERFGRGCYRFIDGKYPGFPLLDIGWCRLITRNTPMHVMSDIIELNQILIAHRPAINGGFHVTEMAEIQIQPDYARHIVRVIPPLEDTSPGCLQIRWLLVQGHPQVMAALRHRHGALVLEKRRLAVIVSVKIQEVNRVFLALGPQALTSYVATNRRQHIKADPTQEGLKQHDGNKWPDDAQQPWRSESPFLLHEIPCANTARLPFGPDRYS
ncbi:hypothetical protein D3C78_626960 [compost metagenome]